jgi:hypothetical protein
MQFVTLSVLILWTQKSFKHIRSFVSVTMFMNILCCCCTVLDAQLRVNISDLCNMTQVIPTLFTQWHLSGQEWSVGTARTTRVVNTIEYYLLNSSLLTYFVSV